MMSYTYLYDGLSLSLVSLSTTPSFASFVDPFSQPIKLGPGTIDDSGRRRTRDRPGQVAKVERRQGRAEVNRQGVGINYKSTSFVCREKKKRFRSRVVRLSLKPLIITRTDCTRTRSALMLSPHFFSSLAKLVGIVIGAIIFVVAIGILCCCCCPFCLLAKKRQNGRVLRNNLPGGERA